MGNAVLCKKEYLFLKHNMAYLYIETSIYF